MGKTNSGKLQAVWETTKVVFQKIGDVFCSIGHFFQILWSLLVRLRKFFMAAPVIIAALWLAQETQERLQGAFRFHIMDIAATIEASDLVIRQVEISKQVAVAGPLVVTGACLLLMFISRRTLYPWIISIFSLVIPVFIIFAGMLPG